MAQLGSAYKEASLEITLCLPYCPVSHQLLQLHRNLNTLWKQCQSKTSRFCKDSTEARSSMGFPWYGRRSIMLAEESQTPRQDKMFYEKVCTHIEWKNKISWVSSAARLIRELSVLNAKLQQQIYVKSRQTGSERPLSCVGGFPTTISSKYILSTGNPHLIDTQQILVRKAHIPLYFTIISSSSPVSSQAYHRPNHIHTSPTQGMNCAMTCHWRTRAQPRHMIRSSARWILIGVRIASITTMVNKYTYGTIELPSVHQLLTARDS